MKVHINYWYGNAVSHYISKRGDHRTAHGNGVPVAPVFPDLPDDGSNVDLSPEDILALAKDFDVRTLERDGEILLDLDRKYGRLHQMG